MGYLFMNWQYHYPKFGNFPHMKMMTCAKFVEMVGIFCVVIYVQGPIIEVEFALFLFLIPLHYFEMVSKILDVNNWCGDHGACYMYKIALH